MTLRLLWDGYEIAARLICDEYIMTGLLNIKDHDVDERQLWDVYKIIMR